MSMETLLEEFLDNLLIVRRLSAHTHSNYQRDLNGFREWCVEQSLTNWQSVSHAHMRVYVAFLHRKGRSGRTIQRHLSAIRSFYHYLIKQGVIDQNPCQDVPIPKSEKKLPKVLNIDQVSHLLDEDSGEWHTIRDAAMFELFYSSGLRLSELVGLNIQHLNLKEAWVEVMGKGNKQRTLPIGQKALEALREWLSFRADGLAEKAQAHDESALFISQLGRRISVRNVQARLKKMALEKGILSEVSPHTLRHTFASHMLESSQNLRAVQELLGHADISTTQIYTHLDFKHLSEVYDASHPRARKRSD